MAVFDHLVGDLRVSQVSLLFDSLYNYTHADPRNSLSRGESMLTLSLVVRKVSLIAISPISFGNENLHICNSLTEWGDQTIRDLIQFATFSTNVRHVLCDLRENAT